MPELKQVYKCEICGNVVEIVGAGPGDLVCCGENMVLLKEKSSDQGLEKHVPVIEKTEKGILVKVGSVPHPMEKEHFIQWIEVVFNGRVYRKHLSPGEKPEAEFPVSLDEAESIKAREYCNLHGLWSAGE